jgi:hypothetical protein
MRKEIPVIGLELDGHAVIVEPGSRAHEHFLGLGYVVPGEPEPAKRRARAKKADGGDE